jgi:hypothetical protein
VHGISGTTSLAATALKKKADKEAEKVLKAKEKALQEKLERSKKAAAAPTKKRSSSSSKRSTSTGKRRKSGVEVVDLSVSGFSGGGGGEAVIDGLYESVTYSPEDEDDTQAPYSDITGPTIQQENMEDQDQGQGQGQGGVVQADSDDDLWGQQAAWRP